MPTNARRGTDVSCWRTRPRMPRWLDALRIFRRRHLARIAWRDLAGIADIETVLRETERCSPMSASRAAYARADGELAARHGAPRRRAGRASAAADPRHGQARRRRAQFLVRHRSRAPVPGARRDRRASARSTYEEYFARLGQRVAQLLAHDDVEGFVYRVDLRLRPFGESGPLVVSFGAFEDYLQQHGRDWERYAYVKARPLDRRVALRGAVSRRAAPVRLSALSRLRRVRIAARHEGADRARSRAARAAGQRQARARRHPRDRVHRAGVPADPRRQRRAAADARVCSTRCRSSPGRSCLPPTAVESSTQSYRFLRRVENRLQQWNDEQTHELPEDELDARAARAMRWASPTGRRSRPRSSAIATASRAVPLD